MRVIDEDALRKHVTDFPDLTQKERATHFKVSDRHYVCLLARLNKIETSMQLSISYRQT